MKEAEKNYKESATIPYRHSSNAFSAKDEKAAAFADVGPAHLKWQEKSETQEGSSSSQGG